MSLLRYLFASRSKSLVKYYICSLEPKYESKLKIKFLPFFIIVLVSLSCASQKNKDRPDYDLFDNLSARYNILHHANTILDEIERENRDSYQPYFYEVLPLFIEPNESSIERQTPLLDSVIQKAKRVIEEKNKSKYAHQAYFILGKAHYFKGHYHQAAAYFQYVSANFPEKQKQRQLAWVWQAKSLLQSRSFEEASSIWDSIFTHIDDYKRIRGFVFANRANFLLATGRQNEATSFLGEALKYRGNRADKLRWHFSLAQLLESQQSYELAATHYRKVARSNASYELAFQAALNSTFLSNLNVEDEGKATQRSLKKMLRDDKNKSFLDQIHYYLGEAYALDGDTNQAIIELNKSIRATTGNRHQATVSYMKLGKIHADAGHYLESRSYYDSAAMVLPVDFKDVNQVRRTLVNHAKVLTNLASIAKQDSLLQITQLDTLLQQQKLTEYAIASFVKLKERQEAEKGKQKKRASINYEYTNSTTTSFQTSFDVNSENLTSSALTDNRFYFNNPDAVGMGVSAFKRRWGNRADQDNWRFSSDFQVIESGPQPSGQLSENPNGSGPDITNTPETLDSLSFVTLELARWKKELPQTTEEIEAMNQKIKSQWVENAEIYRFNLKDYEKSIRAYTTLLRLYPDDVSAAFWWFNLAQLYSKTENPKVEEAKAKLAQSYSESIYAKVILQPNYLQELNADVQRQNQRYERLFTAYESSDYETVIQEIGKPAESAQFAYLRALAVGRIAPVDNFKQELLSVVENFPADSIVKPLAQFQLAFIDSLHEDFAKRSIAIAPNDSLSNNFLAASGLTPWPQMAKKESTPAPRRTINTLAASTIGNQLASTIPVVPQGGNQTIQLAGDPGVQVAQKELVGEEDTLLPSNATYYFVFHVLHPTANLAPSRFGIGQFNRSQFGEKELSHQLKKVGDESQLLYIGPFSSKMEAQLYESRIVPLLGEIMKIPAEFYQTFLVTESVFGTLSDFGKVDDYYHFYKSR